MNIDFLEFTYQSTLRIVRLAIHWEVIDVATIEAVEGTVLGALLGIAGALLGTVVGAVLQYWLEKHRWLRDDQTRFREDLYQSCVSIFHHGTFAIAIAEDPEKAFTGAGEPNEHLMKVMEGRSRVNMLGSASLSLAAEEYINVVVAMAEGSRFDDETRQKLGQTATAFVGQTRTELGISIGERPLR